MTESGTRASLILRLGDPSDDAAWSDFLQIYEPMLLRLASRLGMQDADAREVVQETLVAVSAAVGDFKSANHRGAFRGWLAAITRNKLVDHLARRNKTERGSGDTDVQKWLDQQAGPDSQLSIWNWQEKRQVFEWAAQTVRGQVSEPTWLAFYQTSVMGQPIAEVANELGIREGMVYVARSRVMSRLRKTVQRWTAQQEDV